MFRRVLVADWRACSLCRCPSERSKWCMLLQQSSLPAMIVSCPGISLLIVESGPRNSRSPCRVSIAHCSSLTRWCLQPSPARAIFFWRTEPYIKFETLNPRNPCRGCKARVEREEREREREQEQEQEQLVTSFLRQCFDRLRSMIEKYKPYELLRVWW